MLPFLDFVLNEFEFLLQQNKDKLQNLVKLLEKNILSVKNKFSKKDATDIEAIIL